MGFNASRPGRVKKADILILGAAIVIVTALVIWAVS